MLLAFASYLSNAYVRYLVNREAEDKSYHNRGMEDLLAAETKKKILVNIFIKILKFLYSYSLVIFHCLFCFLI